MKTEITRKLKEDIEMIYELRPVLIISVLMILTINLFIAIYIQIPPATLVTGVVIMKMFLELLALYAVLSIFFIERKNYLLRKIKKILEDNKSYFNSICTTSFRHSSYYECYTYAIYIHNDDITRLGSKITGLGQWKPAGYYFVYGDYKHFLRDVVAINSCSKK